MDANLRKLGQSDLFVSPVAMGCWPIAGMTSLDVNDSDSQKTLGAAIDSGINFFDTAHCYGIEGGSEKMVGHAVQGQRDRLVVATKCGVHWNEDAKKVVDGSRQRLLSECDLSLKRMQLDHIDLMYLHEPDPRLPIEESAVAFNRMIESGKIRFAGLSNVNVNQAQAFHAICPIVAIQPPFNLLQQQIKKDLVPWCSQNNVSVVSYWPLMKGLLAGKIRRNHDFDPQDKRLTYEIFQGEQFESAQIVLDRLDRLSATTKLTVAQLIIAWTISRPFITAALCGAKRDWQIEETAQAMSADLPLSILNEIGTLAGQNA